MVEGAVNGFFSYLTLQKRFSPLTAKGYDTDLKQFFGFLDKEIPKYTLNELTYQDIRSFIASLMDSGISPVSVNRKLSALRSFFKYLLKNKIVENNPTQKVKGPKIPKRLPVFVDENDLGMIF